MLSQNMPIIDVFDVIINFPNFGSMKFIDYCFKISEWQGKITRYIFKDLAKISQIIESIFSRSMKFIDRKEHSLEILTRYCNNSDKSNFPKLLLRIYEIHGTTLTKFTKSLHLLQKLIRIHWIGAFLV